MNTPQINRISRELTPEEQERLKRNRANIAAELPDLAMRDRMRKEARDEATLSGELRRSMHSSSMPLSAIASSVGVPLLVLDEFLTGERTLRSDVMDRLAVALGYVLRLAS